MSNDEEHESWGLSIVKGGLPQVLLGKAAGRALSSLVGGGLAIPAAWLEQRAQAIRDRTRANSAISAAIAKKAGATAGKDDELVDAMIEAALPDLIRKAENRRATAAIAADLLELDPAPSDTPEPPQDFMNVLIRYAEDASSEDLRAVFAKALAGELRSPGSVSLRTLNVLSMMDQKLANAIRGVMGYVGHDNLLPINGPFDRSPLYRDVVRCQSAGLFDFGSANIKTVNEFGFTWWTWPGDIFLLVRGEPGESVRLSGTILTDIGLEVAQIVRGDLQNERATLFAMLDGAARQFPVATVCNGPAALSDMLNRWSNAGYISYPFEPPRP